jgi:hypothetical protein
VVQYYLKKFWVQPGRVLYSCFNAGSVFISSDQTGFSSLGVYFNFGFFLSFIKTMLKYISTIMFENYINDLVCDYKLSLAPILKDLIHTIC